MCVITRFDDVRQILTDTEHFTNETAYLTNATEPCPRALAVRNTFQEEGWVPAKTLNGRDDPDHKAVRSVFNDAFRPSKIEALEDEVRDLAYQLIEDFIDDGHCEWVAQFAIPLRLLIIGKQMGATAKDVELSGVTIPAGSLINIRFSAENRDERRFDNPDALDLDRPRAGRYLAFGSGNITVLAHRLLGGNSIGRLKRWSIASTQCGLQKVKMTSATARIICCGR
jgi:cytochrome P450